MMNLEDTILAISSPPGPAPRGLIRLSGPNAWPLAAIFVPLPSTLSPGWYPNLPLPLLHPTAKLAAVLLFRAPRSFTGQDIAELHLPGSPAILRAALATLLDNAKSVGGGHGPARLADPGEFSARAFFNHKIDLTEAEGIAATINAANETQLRAAASLRQGDVHQWTLDVAEEIANLLARIEAGIDFVDEEGVQFIDEAETLWQIRSIHTMVDQCLKQSIHVDRLDAAPTAVFIGKPNVGKSSLINALAGRERSIASPVAGTTRDMLSVTMHTTFGNVRLIDVPGEEVPTDELRQKMMQAREAALLEADVIVHIFDNPEDAEPEDAEMDRSEQGVPILRIQNKADLLVSSTPWNSPEAPPRPWLQVSAKTGQNLHELRDRIARSATGRDLQFVYRYALNQRHRELLRDVGRALSDAEMLAQTGAGARHPEFLAAELRRALDFLGQVTGTISPDEVLGRIFSRFCIGK